MPDSRSVLITGCSSGIGYACAHGMKARGWRVLATARKREDIKRLEGEGLEVLQLEYRDAQSIRKCADAALERTDGKLAALFNNGAYGQPGAVEDVSVDVLREQFEANFFGWHDLTCRIIPAMRKQEHGRIVQCSSCLGLVSLKYRGAYNATKFALEGLSDAMRQEFAGSGIHVSQIEPGPIDTRFVEHSLAAYRANIDLEGSVHAAIYKERIASMENGGSTRFKLGPEAVLEKLIHALESPDPRAHYYVTTATHLLAWGRRLLSTRLLDRATAGQ
ncbi:MAG: SDR family oxidoreductase [Hyphomicrobiaceae bacterium]|nr:SDR family oxidoreductase [Hyphomicrobiaceae bacterium]